MAPNSTCNCAYFLMFGRKVKTYLSLLVPHVKVSQNDEKGRMRQFKEGDRVQVRNYNGSSKRSFGRVHSKDGHLHYNVFSMFTFHYCECR